MNSEAGVKHKLPHFHAHYNRDSASYVIQDGRILRAAGSLDGRQERLVLAWAEIHKQELIDVWNHLQAGEWDKSWRIAPLE